jgi:hypothetical protein
VTRSSHFNSQKGAGLILFLVILLLNRIYLNFKVSPLGDHTFFQQPEKVGEKGRFQTKSNTSLNSYFCLQKRARKSSLTTSPFSASLLRIL